MGRLTIDISDSDHQKLKIQAVERGMSLRDFVLSQLRPILFEARENREEFRKAMDAWSETRKGLKLERGNRSWHEIIHDGHKW